CPAEHFARHRQIAKHHAIEGDDGHKVPSGRATWRDSVEDCLSSHSPDYGRIRTMLAMEFLLASTTLPLSPMNYIGPVMGAAVFGLLMQTVPDPARRTFNAVFVAGASGVYLNGGFGVWELLYPALATPVVYRALTSHR